MSDFWMDYSTAFLFFKGLIRYRWLSLIEDAPTGKNEIHLAGEGAIAGYLSEYIDQDARRLNPLTGLIITIVLIAAFLPLGQPSFPT